MTDCTFEASDLTQMAIQRAAFHDVKFTGTKLMGVNWSQAAPPLHVEFDECVLSYSSFVEMKLVKVPFRSCILRETNFIDCVLREADFGE